MFGMITGFSLKSAQVFGIFLIKQYEKYKKREFEKQKLIMESYDKYLASLSTLELTNIINECEKKEKYLEKIHNRPLWITCLNVLFPFLAMIICIIIF